LKIPAFDIMTKSDEKIDDGKEYLCRDILHLNKKYNVTVEKCHLLNELQWNQNKIQQPLKSLKVIKKL